MRILVTGAAGFIGSHLVDLLVERHTVVGLDAFMTGSNPLNLSNSSNFQFVKGDIRNVELIGSLLSGKTKFGKIEAVINCAAETHVDRSIDKPISFVDSNVLGTANLLHQSYLHDIEKMVQVSSDEVYGSWNSNITISGLGIVNTNKAGFDESDRLNPSSPYAASKAAGDNLCLAWFKTYELPVCITRCTNNFGPRQFPEKLIPLVINRALHNKEIPVYGNGLNVRDWIFVKNHCLAIETVLKSGQPGEIYNIAGKMEISNLDLIHQILDLLNKPYNLIKFVKDRPAHDARYFINSDKITKLGYIPNRTGWIENLSQTVRWYERALKSSYFEDQII